jgi:tetratricopeptide (TPR) repeat protein
MCRDTDGNEITTANAATASAIDIYTTDWIGYGTRLRSIFAAADADPDCAFVNACAASVHMALEARSGFRAAQPYLSRMRRNAHITTQREHLFIRAVDAWSQGDTKAALGHYRNLVKSNPADIAAAKWAQYHAFNLGDAAAMCAIAEGILPAHSQTPQAWGMLAFAQEQCLDVEAAEDSARCALSMRRAEPWAHHAMAHALTTRSRVNEAIRFLETHSETWGDRSIFIREHNWWHLTLLYLDVGDHSRALATYDRELWNIWPEFAQEQIGAASALWRLELEGVDVGARWTAVGDKIAERGFEHILPFHDIHFIYALAKAGKIGVAENFLHSLAHHALIAREPVWSEIAFPAAQGIFAYATGQYRRAEMLLLPVLGRLHRLGGSPAQRDVILLSWMDAAIKSGNHSAVEDVLTHRAPHRVHSSSVRRFLARTRSPQKGLRWFRKAA